MNARSYCCLICFSYVLGLSTATAQRLDSAATRYLIGFQPLQLVVREAVFSYEWSLCDPVSFRVSLGYRYRNPSAGPNAFINKPPAASYETSQMLNAHHQAVKVAAGPVFYLNRKRSVYLQSEYFFRHWWLNNTRIVVDDLSLESYGFDALRTERVNVYGVKTLLGTNDYLTRSSAKNSLTYTAYLGVGFRVKTYWYESRDGTVRGQKVTYQFEQGIMYLPSLHLGMLINLGIGK